MITIYYIPVCHLSLRLSELLLRATFIDRDMEDDDAESVRLAMSDDDSCALSLAGTSALEASDCLDFLSSLLKLDHPASEWVQENAMGFAICP